MEGVVFFLSLFLSPFHRLRRRRRLLVIAIIVLGSCGWKCFGCFTLRLAKFTVVFAL